MSVAQTILNQLKSGQVSGCANGIHAMGCWGFNKPRATENGLLFDVSGRKLRGSVNVKYNEGTDLYDIDFYNRKSDVVRKLEMVYCDELTSIIDSVVESGK